MQRTLSYHCSEQPDLFAESVLDLPDDSYFRRGLNGISGQLSAWDAAANHGSGQQLPSSWRNAVRLTTVWTAFRIGTAAVAPELPVAPAFRGLQHITKHRLHAVRVELLCVTV
jgi:hypothetical protein